MAAPAPTPSISGVKGRLEALITALADSPHQEAAQRVLTEFVGPAMAALEGSADAAGTAPTDPSATPAEAVAALVRDVVALNTANASNSVAMTALAPLQREVKALAAALAPAAAAPAAADAPAAAGAGGTAGDAAAAAAPVSGRELSYDEEFKAAEEACARAGGKQTREGFTTASGIMFAGFLFPKEGLPPPPDKPVPPPPPAPAPKHAVTPALPGKDDYPGFGGAGGAAGGAGAGAGAGAGSGEKSIVAKGKAAGGAGASAMSDEATARAGTHYGKDTAGFYSSLLAIKVPGGTRFGKKADKTNGPIEVMTGAKGKPKNGPSALLLYDADVPTLKPIRVELAVTKEMKEAEVAREIAAAINLPGIPHDDVWVYHNFATAISHSDSHKPTVHTPAEFAPKAATQGKGDEVRVYLRRRTGVNAANDSVIIFAPLFVAVAFSPGARIDPEAPPAYSKQVTEQLTNKVATVYLTDATSFGMVLEQLANSNFTLPKSERDYAVVLSKDEDGDAAALGEDKRSYVLRAGDRVDIKDLTSKLTKGSRLTLVEHSGGGGVAVTIKSYSGESRVYFVPNLSTTGAQLKALISGPTRLAPDNMVLKFGDADISDTTSLEDVDYSEGAEILQAKKA